MEYVIFGHCGSYLILFYKKSKVHSNILILECWPDLVMVKYYQLRPKYEIKCFVCQSCHSKHCEWMSLADSIVQFFFWIYYYLVFHSVYIVFTVLYFLFTVYEKPYFIVKKQHMQNKT